VFARPASGWAGTINQSAELTQKGRRPGTRFGSPVAVHGATVVVGDPLRETAFVFVRPPAGWSGTLAQNATLKLSTSAGSDAFGSSVAAYGPTVVVGAPGHNVGSNIEEGAAYVFTRPGSGWAGTVTSNLELTDTGGGAGDQFGHAVAVSNRKIVVGVPYHEVGMNFDEGVAYVFLRSKSGWSPTPAYQLRPFSGAALEDLGISVGVTGSAEIAGATGGGCCKGGAVYVYACPPDGLGQGPTATLLTPGSTPSCPTGPRLITPGSPLTLTPTAELISAPHALVGLGAMSSNTIVASSYSSDYVYVDPPPTVTIKTPGFVVYKRGSKVAASYSCKASWPAYVVSCNGPIASGTLINTSRRGLHRFTVVATDDLGGKTRSKVIYAVTKK
jgi:hypothetical protein